MEKKITILGVTLAVILGFLMAAGLTRLLGAKEDTAAFLLYLFWVVCGGGLGCFFKERGI